MKVIKRMPQGLSTMRSALVKAEEGVGGAGRSVKKNLTTTVIGSGQDEEEQEQKGRGGENGSGGGGGNRSWSYGKQYTNKAERPKIRFTPEQRREQLPKKQWMNAGKVQTQNGAKNVSRAAGYPAGGTVQGAGGRSLQGTGRGAVQSAGGGSLQSAGKGALQSAGRGAVQSAAKNTAGAAVKGTVGAAAKTAAGTAAGAAAGAATAGASVAVMAVIAVVKFGVRTGKKMKEALVSGTKGQASGISKGKTKAKDEKGTFGKGGGALPMLLLGLALPFVLVIVVVLFLVFGAAAISLEQGSGGEEIAAVARQEEEAAEQNIGGAKYKEWYGMDADWCVMFLMWCANECGYLEDGILPRTASVATLENWCKSQGLYHDKDSGYEPKPGDIIFFTVTGSHAGLVVEYDRETKTITTVEGNTGRSDTTPYHKGSRVREKSYALTAAKISGYGTPQYPEREILIPEPFGTEYSYMGWQVITSTTSKQYQLKEEAGMNFDANGFGIIGERYVIACTLKFGQVGDYIDWELFDGTVIKTIVGDIKDQADEGCNEWGHRNGQNVVEFVVDKESWYGTDRYPTDFFPEWEQRVVKAIKKGNYWR